MDVFAFTNHLLNFVLPALFVAVFVALASRLTLGRKPPEAGFGRGLWPSICINAAVGIAALTGGLVLFDHDGKMLTYGALVLACGSTQWLLGRGWRD